MPAKRLSDEVAQADDDKPVDGVTRGIFKSILDDYDELIFRYEYKGLVASAIRERKARLSSLLYNHDKAQALLDAEAGSETLLRDDTVPPAGPSERELLEWQKQMGIHVVWDWDGRDSDKIVWHATTDDEAIDVKADDPITAIRAAWGEAHRETGDV